MDKQSSSLYSTGIKASPAPPPSAAALLASLFYAAGSCGRDSSSEVGNDEGSISSDDEKFPRTTAASSFWPRPPSLEWDYGPVLSGNGGICAEDEFPLYDDVGDTHGGLGYGDCLDDEDDDSLADLEDYFLYYRTGDVLFGPSQRNSILRDSLLRGIDLPVPPVSTSVRSSAVRRDERLNLAAKVKSIKAQLSQAKENRAQRCQRVAAGSMENAVVTSKEEDASPQIPVDVPGQVQKLSARELSLRQGY